jgi:hypothetical protein
MRKQVKGILFGDYVRMMRNKKDADWNRYLKPEDLPFLQQKIEDDLWYPFETFERMGLAILQEIAQGNLETVRNWGRREAEIAAQKFNTLVAEGDPRESIMRYQVLRKSFFDFNAVDVLALFGNYARLEIAYGMSKPAEEAASFQALGLFEGLLAKAGATNIAYKFGDKRWEGAAVTSLELEWSEAALDRQVKGILFKDYVRMIRSKKSADWRRHLKPVDLAFLKQRIEDETWYPMDSFERMGLAILAEIARGDVRLVQLWGKGSIDPLIQAHPDLLCPDEPRETLMRFQVLRRSFFDFGAITIQYISGNYAKVEINYGMSKLAEEAATYQALGFFERLLALSGVKKLKYHFLSKAWAGDTTTLLELNWS